MLWHVAPLPARSFGPNPRITLCREKMGEEAVIQDWDRFAGINSNSSKLKLRNVTCKPESRRKRPGTPESFFIPPAHSKTLPLGNWCLTFRYAFTFSFIHLLELCLMDFCGCLVVVVFFVFGFWGFFDLFLPLPVFLTLYLPSCHRLWCFAFKTDTGMDIVLLLICVHTENVLHRILFKCKDMLLSMWGRSLGKWLCDSTCKLCIPRHVCSTYTLSFLCKSNAGPKECWNFICLLIYFTLFYPAWPVKVISLHNKNV